MGQRFMKHYSERPDGTIEYIDRKWFIAQLVEKAYMTIAGNNAENDRGAQDAADKEETWLTGLDDERLAQEYADKIGDPRET